jgi:putative endonuclease
MSVCCCKMLYTGVTNDLDARAFQHKSKLIPGFTQKYNLHKLVYFEAFGNVRKAIRREKQVKGWIRSKKVALIESRNPRWLDLAEEHFKSGTRFKAGAARIDAARPGPSRLYATRLKPAIATKHGDLSS